MSKKYSQPRIWLHWLSAAVIIWGTMSGFYIPLGKPDAETAGLISFINVSLTTCFIPFFVLRIIYCMKHKSPPEEAMQKGTNKIARVMHLVLYVNITVVLVTGVLMMERDINVFNLFSFPAPLSQPHLTQFFHSLHIVFCASLALLVLLHILAVVKHQLAGKGVMHRMLP
ncbi:cytochrome B [Erwinia sp. E602]|uniref:cytochrome b n=1 Tax=Erwinia sp. E602 TaxID=2675378 RepID=UPI001BA7C2DC|nr:cytochrome b/b6 domain-containing protein [Erwinia sp. E602]QUG77114.1 cytochrome B [Erwinia sp. E602]